MNAANYYYAPPFWRMRPLPRVFRFCRLFVVALGLFLLLFVAVFSFAFLPYARSLAAICIALGLGSVSGIFAIRMMGWNPPADVLAFEALKSVVGSSPSSPEFEKIANVCKCRRSGKYWWSAFGVVFELGDEGIRVLIKVRWGYRGELPGGLERDATVKQIIEKLGPPKEAGGAITGAYTMIYDGMAVGTLLNHLHTILLRHDLPLAGGRTAPLPE